MIKSGKQKRSSDNPPKASQSKKAKKQCMPSNKQTRCFQYNDQVYKCLLKANSKVVHFSSEGISLQDSQGSQPLTWVHHFKDKNDSRHLVTFTQKSRNKFMVLKKYSNHLKVTSYSHNGDEPDVQKLQSQGLEQHLFIKHTREARSVSFECHGEGNKNRFLYANEKLSIQDKSESDLPDGQNYFFQLEKISN